MQLTYINAGTKQQCIGHLLAVGRLPASEPRAWHLLSRCSTTEPHAQAFLKACWDYRSAPPGPASLPQIFLPFQVIFLSGGVSYTQLRVCSPKPILQAKVSSQYSSISVGNGYYPRMSTSLDAQASCHTTQHLLMPYLIPTPSYPKPSTMGRVI